MAAVWVAFTAFSLYVTAKAGYWTAFPPFADLNTTQIFWDLVIALNLVMFLLVRRAKERGQPLWPLALCAAATVFVGSIAPLLFVILCAEAYGLVKGHG